MYIFPRGEALSARAASKVYQSPILGTTYLTTAIPCQQPTTTAKAG